MLFADPFAIPASSVLAYGSPTARLREVGSGRLAAGLAWSRRKSPHFLVSVHSFADYRRQSSGRTEGETSGGTEVTGRACGSGSRTLTNVTPMLSLLVFPLRGSRLPASHGSRTTKNPGGYDRSVCMLGAHHCAIPEA